MKRIVLTGGGSAGHVTPNLALVPELKKHFKIYYIGTNGIEKTMLESYPDITFKEISAVKLIRSLTLKNFKIPFKLLKSIKEAKILLKEIRPNIIFSKGGYVSIPVVIAAHSLKIPIISHESDRTMGLANKIIKGYSNKMCISFRETSNSKKCVYTGTPIRQEIFNGNILNAMHLAKFHKNKKTLLFMGGSLGSKVINNAVFKALPILIKKYNIIHIVGKNNLNKTFSYENYYQLEFTNSIQDLFAFADFVICRSGANTIFELLALKKTMLLIPLSKESSRGDQIENAKLFKKYGYANVLFEEDLSKDSLIKEIEKLITNEKSIINNMSKSPIINSNKKIIDIICSYVN